MSSDSTRMRWLLLSRRPDLAARRRRRRSLFWAAAYCSSVSRSGRSLATAIIIPKTVETIASSAEADDDDRQAQLLDPARLGLAGPARADPPRQLRRARMPPSPSRCRHRRRRRSRAFRSGARARARLCRCSRHDLGAVLEALRRSPPTSARAGRRGRGARGACSALLRLALEQRLEVDVVGLDPVAASRRDAGGAAAGVAGEAAALAGRRAGRRAVVGVGEVESVAPDSSPACSSSASARASRSGAARPLRRGGAALPAPSPLRLAGVAPVAAPLRRSGCLGAALGDDARLRRRRLRRSVAERRCGVVGSRPAVARAPFAVARRARRSRGVVVRPNVSPARPGVALIDLEVEIEICRIVVSCHWSSWDGHSA